MRLADAIDLYLGEVSRRYTPATVRKYRQITSYFLDDYEHKNVNEITQDNVEKWLTRWSDSSKATMALHTSIIKCFFRFMKKRGSISDNPAENIDRPKLPKPEDRDVVVVTTKDVQKMFAACEDWGDEICLAVLGYTAARRNAVSRLRWTDVDLQGDADSPHGWIKFREKGSKVFEKPIDSKLRLVLDRAPEHEPDDYVVPNYMPSRVLRAERDNRIVYYRVKRIAERAGVISHVHALRAAFAVFFLESKRGDVAELREWLGHDRLDTTQNYLRGLNRRKALTRSLGMDWSSENANPVLSEGENRTARPSEAALLGGRYPGTEAPDSPSERTVDWGALSEAGESRTGAGGSIPQTVGEGAAPKPTPVSLSALHSADAALSEGVKPARSTKPRTQAGPGDRHPAPSESASDEVSRQAEAPDTLDDALDSRKVLPANVEPISDRRIRDSNPCYRQTKTQANSHTGSLESSSSHDGSCLVTGQRVSLILSRIR